MMMMWRCLVAAFFVVVGVWGRSNSPLMDEEQTRPRNKAAECVFGKQIRELRSQWIPDLGVPIGVLYCMRCECVPFQRKRRIVARVQCRNIKSECPEPTCDEPVLLPGRCCKSCPEDTNSPDMIQDIVSQNVMEEEEKSVKHFAALLTGRSSLDLKNDSLMGEVNKNYDVATGRFTFHRKNLHFSFYISEKAARPRALHFMDSDGNILEEFMLSYSGGLVDSVYQNATRKVCGIWRRLPKDYRRLLKQDKMYVVLIWGNKDTEFALSGKLTRYVALASEQYSSLLEPAPGTDTMMTGAGGTAIISTSSSVSPSIHLAIVFNGLFTSLDSIEVPINVKLVLDEKKQVILEENVNVYKPATDLNLLELSSPVSQADLRSLSRGRVFLIVSSVSKPEALSLSGSVITKVACEIFQATLSSEKESPDGFPGLVWMYLNNQGSLIYNIQVDSPVSEQFHRISLADASGKKKAEVLTPYLHNGWANGTEDREVHKILEPLYNGKLDVKIAIANETLHGHLKSKLVADARDASAPILLKRENYTLSSNVVGIAWLSVDSDCQIQYDISLSGLGHDRKFELYMEMYPIIAPGAPFIYKHLEDFEGNQVEGSPVEALTKDELDRLDGGVSFLRIKDAASKIVLLSATITKMKIPSSCRQPHNDNNIPTLPDTPVDVIPQEDSDCYLDDRFYKKDTSWISSKDVCQMCFCQDGVSKCDSMTCPKLDCPNGNLTAVVGECCPICKGNESARSAGQKCLFSGRTYSLGSKFHPFLIPTGFDVCTECYCDPEKSEVTCKRLDDTDKRCCRNCKKATETIEDDPPYWRLWNKQNKERVVHRPPADVMQEGGCRNLNNPKEPYANGSSYHPFIGYLGEYKCITCNCNNGNQTCVRQRCEWKQCKKMFEMRKQRRAKKQPMNMSDFCCNLSECKKMRHKKRVEEKAVALHKQ